MCFKDLFPPYFKNSKSKPFLKTFEDHKKRLPVDYRLEFKVKFSDKPR